MEEVKRMRLEHLSIVHEAADFFGRRGQLVHAHDQIHGLGGSQMMADRTDAAESLNQDRDFPVGAALDESFEPTEFDNMKAGLLNHVVLIQKERYLAVAFDASHGLDDHPLQFFRFRHGDPP
jgi:hypothetical protein